MTAIVTLENADINDIVTVSKNATKAPKVKMYLSEGEKVKLEYLLYALMLESSNDAAVAIAEHVGGDVETFCNMMTEKAQELGAVNTVFKTPNGLDSNEPEHMSTAYDMALIGRYAVDNPELIKIMNTKTASFDSDKRHYSFYNRNKLLSMYQGANGGKTGYTNKAGNCFVGLVKQGDMQLISVVLGSGWGNTGKERKWTETVKLLDYGFDNFSYETIFSGEKEVGKLKIENSKVAMIPVFVSGEFVYPVTVEEVDSITEEVNYTQSLQAPIDPDEIVGTYKLILNDEEIYSMDIKTRYGAEIFDYIYVLEKLCSRVLGVGSQSKVKVELREIIENVEEKYNNIFG